MKFAVFVRLNMTNRDEGADLFFGESNGSPNILGLLR